MLEVDWGSLDQAPCSNVTPVSVSLPPQTDGEMKGTPGRSSVFVRTGLVPKSLESLKAQESKVPAQHAGKSPTSVRSFHVKRMIDDGSINTRQPLLKKKGR